MLDPSGNAQLYGFSDWSSGNNPRSVAMSDNKVYLSGGAGGVRYVDLSALTAGSVNNTSLQLATDVTNIRALSVYDAQLYASSGSGSTRLATIGTGLPTANGQATTNIPGIPTTGSPYQFYFADLTTTVAGVDTLYVADDGAAALTKYSLVGGSWTSNGVVGADADDYRGITGVVDQGTVVLYAVRKGGSGTTGGGELVKLTDTTGYNGAFSGTPTVLSSAATRGNVAYRGVALVPADTTGAPTVSFATTTLSRAEGNSGTTTYTFQVSRSGRRLVHPQLIGV